MKAYDILGLAQLIERGLHRKLEVLENAINVLGSNLEPVTVVENYAFIANKSNGELYRVRYEVSEGNVRFSNPEKFIIESDADRYDRQERKVIRGIVDALAEGDESLVTHYKAKFVETQRQKNQLESALNLSIGTRSKYLANQKSIVEAAVEAHPKFKSVAAKAKKDDKFEELVKDGEVEIDVDEKPKAKAKRDRTIETAVVEARKQARGLTESPLFTDYVLCLYNGEDVSEAVEAIAENYQEIFTLSLAEQTEVFYAIVEASLESKPDLQRVVESIMSVMKFAVESEEISAEIDRLSEVVGSTGKDFHKRMKLIEDELNSRTFSAGEIKTIRAVLEDIISNPSELMAPEFVIEARKMLSRVRAMEESGMADDAVIQTAVNLITQFYPAQIGEGKSEATEAYQKFFQEKLGKYGVSSPAELSDEEKKKFFDEIEKEWKGDSEGKGDDADQTIYDEEPVDEMTGFPVGSLEVILEGRKDHTPADEPEEQDAEAEELQDGLGIGKAKNCGELRKVFRKHKGNAEALAAMKKRAKELAKDGDEDAADLIDDIETEEMVS